MGAGDWEVIGSLPLFDQKDIVCSDIISIVFAIILLLTSCDWSCFLSTIRVLFALTIVDIFLGRIGAYIEHL